MHRWRLLCRSILRYLAGYPTKTGEDPIKSDESHNAIAAAFGAAIPWYGVLIINPVLAKVALIIGG